MDILTLAADSAYGDEGVISLAPGCGLTDWQIANMLNVALEIWMKIKERLVDTSRITINSANEIKVINWKKYQSEYARQRPYRKRLQAKVTTKSATKGYKEKEKENINTSCPKLKFTDEDMELVKELETLIKDVDPKHKFGGGQRKEKWANSFRLMRERDGRSLEDIRAIMDFAFRDSFWSAVIQSAESLRKNYNQLRAKMLKGERSEEKRECPRPPYLG